MTFNYKNKLQLILGVLLILLGVLHYYGLYLWGITNTAGYISILFLIYGAVSTYLNFDKQESFKIFISTSIFLTGVVIFTFNFFEILFVNKLITTAFVFIPGAAFLLSYFSEPGRTKLLIYSLAWWGLSLLVCSFTPENLIAEQLTDLFNYIFPFLPLIIILYGVMLLRK